MHDNQFMTEATGHDASTIRQTCHALNLEPVMACYTRLTKDLIDGDIVIR